LKKKTIQRKRAERKESKEEKVLKIKWQVLAANLIYAIEHNEISYRDFKQAANRIDEKYWKPLFVNAPKIKG